MPKKQTQKRTSQKQKRSSNESEPDGRFLLKLVIVVMVASLWIKFSTPLQWGGVLLTALPIGVFAGLILVHLFEHFQTDRKIWYTVLVMVGIVSYFVPSGIII